MGPYYCLLRLCPVIIMRLSIKQKNAEKNDNCDSQFHKGCCQTINNNSWRIRPTPSGVQTEICTSLTPGAKSLEPFWVETFVNDDYNLKQLKDKGVVVTQKENLILDK